MFCGMVLAPPKRKQCMIQFGLLQLDSRVAWLVTVGMLYTHHKESTLMALNDTSRAHPQLLVLFLGILVP